jgi:hypothetical protein
VPTLKFARQTAGEHVADAATAKVAAGQAVQSITAVVFPVPVVVPKPTAQAEAVHSLAFAAEYVATGQVPHAVYAASACSVALNVPAVHCAQAPLAVADPDPAGHTADRF